MRSPFQILLTSAVGLLLSFSARSIIIADKTATDTTGLNTATHNSYTADSASNNMLFHLSELDAMVRSTGRATLHLGKTAQGKDINAYYFKGVSSLNALVMAGIHGSELSSIEVAEQLIDSLSVGPLPFYNVIIIPNLFPDNAATALDRPAEMGSHLNIGRYSWTGATDPNRQMPSPGRPFDPSAPLDHIGREIENENKFLLTLIQQFRPVRIASLHAIRNTAYGGIYADPRTDEKSIALGYESDSALAVTMASAARRYGSNVEGNRLGSKPNALYYKDPKPAPAGKWQKRNMSQPGARITPGSGVSMGTWGTTAVRVSDTVLCRPAMRVITMEFPGAKRPVDYTKPQDQLKCQQQVTGYVAAIRDVFLAGFHEESDDPAFSQQ